MWIVIVFDLILYQLLTMFPLMVKYMVIFMSAVLLAGCSASSNPLEEALQQAGENRHQLEAARYPSATSPESATQTSPSPTVPSRPPLKPTYGTSSPSSPAPRRAPDLPLGAGRADPHPLPHPPSQPESLCRMETLPWATEYFVYFHEYHIS